MLTSVGSKGEKGEMGPSVGHGFGTFVSTGRTQRLIPPVAQAARLSTGATQVAQALYAVAAGVVQDHDVSVAMDPVQVPRWGSAFSTHVST